jgi:hypothetical protein
MKAFGDEMGALLTQANLSPKVVVPSLVGAVASQALAISEAKVQGSDELTIETLSEGASLLQECMFGENMDEAADLLLKQLQELMPHLEGLVSQSGVSAMTSEIGCALLKKICKDVPSSSKVIEATPVKESAPTVFTFGQVAKAQEPEKKEAAEESGKDSSVSVSCLLVGLLRLWNSGDLYHAFVLAFTVCPVI